MKNTLTDKKGDAVLIEATALTPIAYKHVFGADMLKEINKIKNGDKDPEDIYDLASQMAFIMATQAANLNDYQAVMNATIDSYYEFLNNFDSDYFNNMEHYYVILGTWFNNADVIDKAKNLQSPQNEN